MEVAIFICMVVRRPSLYACVEVDIFVSRWPSCMAVRWLSLLVRVEAAIFVRW